MSEEGQPDGGPGPIETPGQEENSPAPSDVPDAPADPEAPGAGEAPDPPSKSQGDASGAETHDAVAPAPDDAPETGAADGDDDPGQAEVAGGQPPQDDVVAPEEASPEADKTGGSAEPVTDDLSGAEQAEEKPEEEPEEPKEKLEGLQDNPDTGAPELPPPEADTDPQPQGGDAPPTQPQDPTNEEPPGSPDSTAPQGSPEATGALSETPGDDTVPTATDGAAGDAPEGDGAPAGSVPPGEADSSHAPSVPEISQDAESDDHGDHGDHGEGEPDDTNPDTAAGENLTTVVATGPAESATAAADEPAPPTEPAEPAELIEPPEPVDSGEPAGTMEPSTGTGTSAPPEPPQDLDQSQSHEQPEEVQQPEESQEAEQLPQQDTAPDLQPEEPQDVHSEAEPHEGPEEAGGSEGLERPGASGDSPDSPDSPESREPGDSGEPGELPPPPEEPDDNSPPSQPEADEPLERPDTVPDDQPGADDQVGPGADDTAAAGPETGTESRVEADNPAGEHAPSATEVQLPSEGGFDGAEVEGDTRVAPAPSDSPNPPPAPVPEQDDGQESSSSFTDAEPSGAADSGNLEDTTNGKSGPAERSEEALSGETNPPTNQALVQETGERPGETASTPLDHEPEPIEEAIAGPVEPVKPQGESASESHLPENPPSSAPNDHDGPLGASQNASQEEAAGSLGGEDTKASSPSPSPSPGTLDGRSSESGSSSQPTTGLDDPGIPEADEVTELKAELAVTANHNRTMSELNDGLKSECDALMKQNEELRQALEKERETSEDLGKQLREALEARDAAQAEAKSIQPVAEETEETERRLQEQVLSQHLTEANRIISKLKLDVSSKQEELLHIQRDLEDVERARQEAEARLATAEEDRRMAILEERIKARAEVTEQFQADHAAELEALKNRISALKASLDKKDGQIQAAAQDTEQRLAAKEEYIRCCVLEIEALKRRIKDFESNVVTDQDILKAKDEKLDRKRKEIRSLKQDIERKNRLIEQYQSGIEKLINSSRSSAMSETIRKITTELGKLNAFLGNQTSRLRNSMSGGSMLDGSSLIDSSFRSTGSRGATGQTANDSLTSLLDSYSRSLRTSQGLSSSQKMTSATVQSPARGWTMASAETLTEDQLSDGAAQEPRRAKSSLSSTVGAWRSRSIAEPDAQAAPMGSLRTSVVGEAEKAQKKPKRRWFFGLF